jgi:hypothetical protein
MQFARLKNCQTIPVGAPENSTMLPIDIVHDNVYVKTDPTALLAHLLDLLQRPGRTHAQLVFDVVTEVDRWEVLDDAAFAGGETEAKIPR